MDLGVKRGHISYIIDFFPACFVSLRNSNTNVIASRISRRVIIMCVRQ